MILHMGAAGVSNAVLPPRSIALSSGTTLSTSRSGLALAPAPGTDLRASDPPPPPPPPPRQTVIPSRVAGGAMLAARQAGYAIAPADCGPMPRGAGADASGIVHVSIDPAINAWRACMAKASRAPTVSTQPASPDVVPGGQQSSPSGASYPSSAYTPGGYAAGGAIAPSGGGGGGGVGVASDPAAAAATQASNPSAAAPAPSSSSTGLLVGLGAGAVAIGLGVFFLTR